MLFSREIKRYVLNRREDLLIYLARKNEVKKFSDIRRKEIYEQVTLTTEQKKEIDLLYKQYLGEKIPYIWHRHYTAFTGKFDSRYFPELLFIPEFERYMNVNTEYNCVFSDKNVLPLIASSANIKMPATLLSCTYGIFRNSESCLLDRGEVNGVLNNAGDLFIKPSVDSCSGDGCAALRFINGVDQISGSTIDEVLDRQGQNFVIQERIIAHKSLRDIYPNSINTFRIISYIWKDEIILMPGIMRIGQGGSVLDNAHAGGMFIGVNEDGTLCKKAYTEFKSEFDYHPDTNLCFEGHKVAGYDSVLQAAKKLHELIPQIGIINWDFTIDQQGLPVLIEANISGGSIWLIQMAHGKGAFENKLEEVLEWIAFMRTLTYSERRNYLFGKRGQA